MRKIAFLSMDDLTDFFVYDDLLEAPFAAAGYLVSTVSWHEQDHDFTQYDAVIVRSTWDYQQDAEQFLHCLSSLHQQGVVLENPLALMQWNMEKSYLRDLAHQGVLIVQTLWLESFSMTLAQQAFHQFHCDEIIIKPLLSANADDTFRLTAVDLKEQENVLAACFNNRKLMIQPFMHSVVEEGEYSLFYFAGEFSHGILKQPKVGDFRVQEEHGGRLSNIQPDDTMLAAAAQSLAAMPTTALYARVDLIRTAQGWALMELELIEPSLYFNLDPDSAQRFVDAFIARNG
jgi:hypothetical protein